MRHTITLTLVAFGCSSCATPQEPPPCDAASYAVISASCGDDELECNRKIDEHEAHCARKIRGVE